MVISLGRLNSSAFRVRIARLFALLLLLLLGGGFGKAQAAGITLVQHVGKDAGTTTTSTLAFTSANTAGNFIAVAVRGGLSSSQVFTVTDSNGNTYKKEAQIGYTASQVTSAIYYAENIKAGANTITVSMTVSGPLRFDVLEYSGVATANSLDATAVATGSSATPNSGNLTTTVAGDLLLATVGTTNPATFTAGTAYTIRDFVPAEPSTKHIGEDRIQSAAGIASAGASLTASDSWGAVLAAFKPAGGVAGSPASITASAGTPQSATINTAFATQLQATVKDPFNNPVSGATVTFTAPASGAGGTLAGGVTTATTNASGVATAAIFTANTTAGTYTVTASVSGVSTPASFSLTNLAGAAASIAATAGTPQSAAVNAAFATQLQATVKDSFSNPVSGATVAFTAPGSGASGTFAGGVNTATTNASGIATAAVFTANTSAGGPYTVTASVVGVSTPANFSLTNLAGALASITATAGTPQSTTVNTAFATQLQATVKDSFSNPVSGVTVTFAAPASGASGAFAGGVKTATTNASGIATAAVFTANTTAGGPYTVTASASGLSTPANFSLTNLTGAAASITATAGTPQSATINTAFATQLQATVKDSFGNPVSGVLVTFAAPTNGASGTFAGGVNTATTNASGVATAAVFTANGTSGGPYTVTASASGIATSANFSLTNLGNPPANIVATAGTPQSATINTAFAVQLQVTVTDSGNNPVSGVTVTFTAPSSGPSGTFAGGVNTATTNASGVATSAVFTANSIAGGPYMVSATVSGVATPANFYLTNLTGAAASITSTAGTPQSATIGTAYPTPFQATVKDAGNNPVSGVTVTFSAPTSGASGTFAGGVTTATTNASGVATAAVFIANTAAGAYTVTASVSGVSTLANFSLTNLAGAAASIAATAGTPQSATVNTAFAVQLQATVKDSFNNPVSGVTVTFTAPTSGASGSFAGGINTAMTNASGVATAAVFTANATVGGPYTVTASVSGVSTPANFSLTNLASVAANITLVQHTSLNLTATTSGSLAFKSNNTVGNWIAVCIRGGFSSLQVFTITDSIGNSYQQASQLGFTPNAVTLAIYYAENIKGGANTITVSQSVSGPLRFAILEYSGVATSNSRDVTAVATATSTSPNSGNMTTTASGDLLLGAVATTNPAAFTAGSGYTIEEFVGPEPGTKLIAEDQIQLAAGTASVSASLASSDNWGAVLAAFRAANGVVLPISVNVTPATASVPTGNGTQNFSASLANDSSHQGVIWSLSGAGCTASACGTLTNVTTTSVTYNGPANVPSPATVTLTATAVADSTKTATATVTVTQGVLSVLVHPNRAAVTMSASQTVQITATVANDPQNLGVTWQVDGSNGGNAATGTVSATGLFTPGTQPGQHTVTAVSNANASVSASTMVAVTDLTGVYLHHNDPQRTGQNLKEYGLTPALVNSATFSKLFSCPVDGFAYAQPLWVANLTFGATTRNVVFVATEHDSVYAFDADSPACVQLWKVSFLGTGVTTLLPSDVGGKTDVIPEIGITSTPVIDPATNTLYVAPKTKETVGTVNGQTCTTGSPCFVHRLHALDLITGAEKFGGPVAISAANFNSLWHMQRPALLLANNTVYLAFGSHGDLCPYYGWVMGYNALTLAQVFVRPLTNPATGCSLSGDLGAGGIWQSGAGPAADAVGNVYVSTGNGAYDGSSNWGDSAVKLGPTGSVLDWFTPFNEEVFRANDVDLGSAGVIILPDSVGSTMHPHLALATGKVGILYLLDQTNMGKFNSTSNKDVQEAIPVPPPNTTSGNGGIFGVPAYWNGNIYTAGVSFPLSQFQISNGAIVTPQSANSTNKFPLRGATPVVSATGTANGVVWILDLTAWQTNGAAILDAYDATNVSTLLYSSPGSGSGAAGPAVKFTVPTVANGKVYIGGQYTFTVFGLLP